VPYVPNFGDYLNSMFGLIMPMMVFSYTASLIDEHQDGIKQEFISKKSRIIETPIYLVIFVFIVLISRVFPIFMIGIGSESMTGSINKGDAVIAYKSIGEPKINENDVIVFEVPGKILIHRVVEIEEIDGIKYYRTKGDANVWAMGSPKLDLWVDSWNAVYPEDKIYIAKTTSAMDDGLEGNYLGLTENPTTTYISGTNMRQKQDIIIHYIIHIKIL